MFHIGRTEWDTFFMLQAHLVATRSTCDRGPELFFDAGRHGVGAVLVKDHRVIASGYNGSPPGFPHCSDCAEKGGGHLMREGHCCRTLHSELNALLQCALDGVSPVGATLYTTASPCYDCTKAILRAQIKEVWFGQYYDSRYGLSGDSKTLLEEAGIACRELVLKQEDFYHKLPICQPSSVRKIPTYYLKTTPLGSPMKCLCGNTLFSALGDMRHTPDSCSIEKQDLKYFFCKICGHVYSTTMGYEPEMIEPEVTVVEETKNAMIKVKGEPFSCKCGCNVFTKFVVTKEDGQLARYQCNSCENCYEGI